MIFNNVLFPNNNLHIYSYEIIDNILYLKIINRNKELIQSINILYGENNYLIEVNSSSQILSLKQEVSLSFYNDKPSIVSFSTNEKLYQFDTSKKEFIILPKSINNMHNEKYLYEKKLSKALNCPKKNIITLPALYPSYWHCCCGCVNLNEQEECLNCHLKKNDVTSIKIDTSEDELASRKIIKSNSYIFFWMIIIWAIQLFVVFLLAKGDLLYHNQYFNEWYTIINKFIVPLIVPLSTIGIIISRKFYAHLGEYLFKITRLISLIYINILPWVNFIKFSYNFVIVIGYDLVFIGYFIYSILKLKKYKIPQSIFISSLVICLLINGFYVINYGKYTFTLNKDGIDITCTENKETYKVPEYIGKEKVNRLTFDEDRDYSNIKYLYISKYIQSIDLTSMLLLPNLINVYVDESSSYFEVKDNILFKKNSSKIAIIPEQTKSLTINWENVEEKSFSELINLEEVTISSNVKNLGESCFEYCISLKEINFEENSSLETIGSHCFDYCSSLKSIYIPSSINNIGVAILSNCKNIKDISIPFIGDKRYNSYASSNKNVFTYLFDGSYNFFSSNKDIILDNVTIREQTFLQPSSFAYCQVNNLNITLESGNIEKNCFYEATFEKFIIPENIKEIKEYGFYNCSFLKSITLPSTLTKIEKNSFLNCSSLEEVIVPSSLDLSKVEIEKEGNEKILSLINV